MKLRSYSRLLALSLAVVSGIVIAWGPAGAQGAARERETGTLTFTPQLNGRPGASTPINHALKGTIFDASSPGASASCSSAGCSAYAQMYLESVVCPRTAGSTCTYQITIQSQNHAGSNDGKLGEEGLYQFLVDGVAPTPGPVASSCACYTWSGASRLFSLPIRGTSYAVTATVTNNSANQAHSIAVNIGCSETHGNISGCFAGSGFANLSIATYTP